jgi:hypothetical protein
VESTQGGSHDRNHNRRFLLLRLSSMRLRIRWGTLLRQLLLRVSAGASNQREPGDIVRYLTGHARDRFAVYDAPGPVYAAEAGIRVPGISDRQPWPLVDSSRWFFLHLCST